MITAGHFISLPILLKAMTIKSGLARNGRVYWDQTVAETVRWLQSMSKSMFLGRCEER